jgi:antirestriction protein ArdC
LPTLARANLLRLSRGVADETLRFDPSQNWSLNSTLRSCAQALTLTPELRPDHAAYIATWLEVLKRDSRAVFAAAAHAQRAADYVHGLQTPS